MQKMQTFHTIIITHKWEMCSIMLRFLKTFSSSRERSGQVIPESTTSITMTVIVTQGTWNGKQAQAEDLSVGPTRDRCQEIVKYP